MNLTSEKVSEIFEDCLFRNEEIVDGKPNLKPIEIEGIISKFGFHPLRTESHRAEIIELLNELPEQFRQDKGGGWSFLQACMDKNGHQWGEHRNMEQLFALGMAIEKVSYAIPKEMWSMLPGNMPYLTIKKD
jgi:hypothetical protein